MPRNAAVYVVLAAIVGYAGMRVVFHASGSDAFFWGSTLGALALLIVYLLVVAAAGALIRCSREYARWMLLIPAFASLAIIYTLWVNIYPPQPGAYRVIPWIVVLWICAPVLATLLVPRIVGCIRAGFLAARSREQ